MRLCTPEQTVIKYLHTYHSKCQYDSNDTNSHVIFHKELLYVTDAALSRIRNIHNKLTRFITFISKLPISISYVYSQPLCSLLLSRVRYVYLDYLYRPAVGAVAYSIELVTESREVAGSTHTRSTASNLEQVANLLCAQDNSASYPSAGREMSSSYGYGVKA